MTVAAAPVHSQSAGRLTTAVLLGTTMLTAQPVLAETVCALDGTIQTCSGDLSEGLALIGSVATLHVEELSADIAPQAGVAGIAYHSDLAATLLTNTGAFSIVTNGADAVEVSSIGGDVYINHTGDILAEGGRGIFGSADNGAVVIEGAGAVLAEFDAISGDPRAGDAVVNWQGDLTSTAGRAIALNAANGAASASGRGVILAQQDAVAIESRGADAPSSFEWTGDITSDSGHAVKLVAHNAGASFVGTGTIAAELDAITLAALGHNAHSSVNFTGDITSASGTAIVITADDGSVSLAASGDVSGKIDGISLIARGWSANAVLDWSDSASATERHAISVYAANGAAYATGSGTVHAAEVGVFVKSEGSAHEAVLVWDGNITSTGSDGAKVQTANGAVTLRGSGTVSGAVNGLYAMALGGNSQVIWDGSVTALAGYGIKATSSTDAATVRGTGSVIAKLDGITASALSGRDAVIDYTGSVTSLDGHGIIAYSASGSSTVLGSGTVIGALDGINVTSEDNATSSLTWNGAVTGQTGEGIYVYSANGAAAAHGTGTVQGRSDAILVQSDGAATASLHWTGSILSVGHGSGYNGVRIVSAQGAVASQTDGSIRSDGGGIYARTGTDDSSRTLSVIHTGTLTAGGVGIEASSPASAIIVRAVGDIDAGSYGIYADGRGASAVNVEQTGAILSGFDGISAYSAQGDVTIVQSGAINAYVDGLRAVSEGSASVYVNKTGALVAREDGIFASSATGQVVVRASGVQIDSGHSGIVARNLGDLSSVYVELDGSIEADLDGIEASSANGEVYVSVAGAITANGIGVLSVNQGTGAVGISSAADISAGGDGLVARSATGNVTLEVLSGTVMSGANAALIAGHGNLSANIAAGASLSGGEDAAGVEFSGGGGSTSALVNFGTIKNAGGIDELAVLSSSADTFVHNHGTISGNVRLGAWANDFQNYASGVLESGSSIELGFGNTLRSAGTISPGGDGNVLATSITGNLTTSQTSKLAFDVDLVGQASDHIALSGAAALGGQVVLSFTSLNLSALTFEILTAGGGVEAQDLRLGGNAFVSGTLERSQDGQALSVALGPIDLAPAGGGAVGSAIGGYLTRAIAAGDASAADFAALVVTAGNSMTAAEIYDELRPAIALDGARAIGLQSIGFANTMLSCPLPSGLSAPLREGSCEWSRLDHSYSAKDGSTTRTYGISYGLQRALGTSDWRAGAAIGFVTLDSVTDNGSQSSGERFNAGVSAKYAPGPLQFAATLSGTWGHTDAYRRVNLHELPQTLTSKSYISTYNFKLRGAYLIGSDSLYLIPQVDLNTTYLVADGYTETGGSAALRIDDVKDTSFSLSPAVEIGTNRRWEDGGVIRAFARIGTSFYSSNGVDLTARLASDSSGVDGFTLNGRAERQLWDLGAGFNVFDLGGWSAEARLNVSLGSDTRNHQASLKVRKSF